MKLISNNRYIRKRQLPDWAIALERIKNNVLPTGGFVDVDGCLETIEFYKEKGVYNKPAIILMPAGKLGFNIGLDTATNQVIELPFTRDDPSSRVTKAAKWEGVLSNTPKLDYANNQPEWLFENTQTNLVDYSNRAGTQDGSWSSSSSRVKILATVDGVLGKPDARLLEAISGALCRYSVALNTGTTYTFSIFVRVPPGSTTSWVRLDFGDKGNEMFHNISEEWQRLSITRQMDGTELGFVDVKFGPDGGTLEVSQALLVTSPFEDSPIHTEGTTVTRDSGVLSAPALLSLSSYTLFADSIPDLLVNSNDTGSGISLHHQNRNYTLLGARNGGYTVYSGNNAPTGVYWNYGVKFKNRFTCRLDNGLASIFTGGAKILSDFDYSIDNPGNFTGFTVRGGLQKYTRVKKLALFKEPLSDAECQGLTAS